ncbi:hypothetical protein B0H13DRAFT_1884182 [Mycena leptocephala]|nr:hypothetical protein B0H13DRAFT_1884182 [Mycena leptocephala]
MALSLSRESLWSLRRGSGPAALEMAVGSGASSAGWVLDGRQYHKKKERKKKWGKENRWTPPPLARRNGTHLANRAVKGHRVLADACWMRVNAGVVPSRCASAHPGRPASSKSFFDDLESRRTSPPSPSPSRISLVARIRRQRALVIGGVGPSSSGTKVKVASVAQLQSLV